MKSKQGRAGSKTKSVVALVVVLLLTIALVVVGFTQHWVPTNGSLDSLAFRLGLDLQGGMYMEYEATKPDNFEGDFEVALERTIDVIQMRMTDSGHAEATVQRIDTADKHFIRVEVPTKLENEAEYENIKALINGTGELEFKDPNGNTFMTGAMVQSAQYYYDQGDHQIAFQLTSEGTQIFAEMTRNNINRTIAIWLDGEELIAPTVQSAITNGSGVINGLGSADRANRIATQIQSGALPLKLRIDNDSTVAASLGQDALSTSITAAFIGILLIMALMIIRYRLNGAIASWALVIYIVLLFGLIVLFGVELTLPGLAGVVLGIGMAVDANVIIFERFNEEARAGRSAKASVRAGFKNALSAILDANVTTLIAAIVLLIFGTGPIKGFAKTLMLGVVVSMITAILITRFLMNQFVSAGATEMKLYTTVKTEQEVEQ